MYTRVLEAFEGDKEKADRAILQQDSIWRTGRDITGERTGELVIQDAVALQNASIVIPHVMTQFVKEGIEPMLIGTRLLTRIQYQPGLQIQFPAIGAIYAEDAGFGQSLPEITVDIGGQATHEIKVGRSGLALKIFEDVMRYSQYNLVAFWLKKAGEALARHKEEKIFRFITEMGTTVFDNVTRSNGLSGSYTSGRDREGLLNGSMTMDDVMTMYTYGLQQGFQMDTILVHPLTWLMWLRDPVLRTFQLQYGGGTWWNPWEGDPSGRNDLASFAPLGEGIGQHNNPPSNAGDAPVATPLVDLDQRLTSRPKMPGYAGLSFNIIVSPFVPFNVTNNTADMIMFNSQNLGALIVDKDPRVLEWTEPQYTITKMQIEETYGLAIMNEGQGIITAKNIKVAANKIADDNLYATASVTLPSGLQDPEGPGIASPI